MDHFVNCEVADSGVLHMRAVSAKLNSGFESGVCFEFIGELICAGVCDFHMRYCIESKVNVEHLQKYSQSGVQKPFIPNHLPSC